MPAKRFCGGKNLCESADPAQLLAWYDIHARELPWRISPAARVAGVTPDPYAVWVSEIMLQQTGVAVVRDYFTRFLSLWPDVKTLAEAADDRVMGEWAGLGYYARARNLLKCARFVDGELNGVFPDTRDALMQLPGIGPYTSAAIAAIAFDRAEVVVDGNVERVMARLFVVREPLPAAKPILQGHAAHMTRPVRPGDYAQAVMDLGATICTPKRPKCGLCPWSGACLARQEGIEATLPLRLKKSVKPTRYGIVFLAHRSDGAWLVERRPDRGLLGGMLGWPGSEWGAEYVETTPPVVANWSDPGVEVRHTFTHFHLRLSLRVAVVGDDAQPQKGFFLNADDLRPTALPSVMRKAFQAAFLDGSQ